MKASDSIFVGIKGSVVALDRASGMQAWAVHLKGGDFVNVLVESERIYATCSGEIFCLDAVTGTPLWHNGLKGFGRGLATMATIDTPSQGLTPAMAEKRRRDQQAAAAAGAAAASAA